MSHYMSQNKHHYIYDNDHNYYYDEHKIILLQSIYLLYFMSDRHSTNITVISHQHGH